MQTLNLRSLKNQKFAISRVFCTTGQKSGNTRVLKGLKTLKPLGFIGI